MAQRAACTLHAFDRSAIWRRLVVIACEDVGVGDIDALLETFLAATSTDFRRQCGEASVLGAVVRRLAEAVKDRSGDYLACAAADHPDLSATCRFCKEASLEKRLELLADFSQPLAKRAVAAWYASASTLVTRIRCRAGTCMPWQRHIARLERAMSSPTRWC